MLTYEYECEKCGYQFENFQNMSDTPVDTCPECSGAVYRLVNGSDGFNLKGSGFHYTGYKKNTSNPVCGREARFCVRSETSNSSPYSDGKK